MAAAARFLDILQLLARHGVDFILVGGFAAVLEGAPVSTFDVDIVPRPAPEVRERLLAALREVNARYLDPAGRVIEPDAVKLETLKVQRLVTDLGILDVLNQIGDGLTYADLLGETQVQDVGGFPVRVLNLATIIRSKEAANREKDLATLPILRRTLRLKNASHDE
jgi:hypothetical protein